MPELTIELAEGRTLAQKRALVENLTRAVSESIGCDPAVVTITIHEIPLEHKAKGGVLFSDRPEKVAMREEARKADLQAWRDETTAV
ncbi:MAG TPA: tautomerase family protein [bacterium]|nr:tautomerase family protein [bacterium]